MRIIRNPRASWRGVHLSPHWHVFRVLYSQVQKTPMDFDTFDTDIFQEICDAPGEIFDIPEMQDPEKFDIEGYINGNTDY